MSSSFEEVKVAIGKVEDDIKEVKEAIKLLEPTIEEAAREAKEASKAGNDKMFEYWRDEKNKLRDEKNKLLDEKLVLEKQRGQLAQALAPPPPTEPRVKTQH